MFFVCPWINLLPHKWKTNLFGCLFIRLLYYFIVNIICWRNSIQRPALQFRSQLFVTGVFAFDRKERERQIIARDFSVHALRTECLTMLTEQTDVVQSWPWLNESMRIFAAWCFARRELINWFLPAFNLLYFIK